MNTPVCDFVSGYIEGRTVRMHMPGHKGIDYPADITEIRGADELYHSEGILRESEENAARLFGAARTIYSCEGSSLCIRAMLRLACAHALMNGRKPRVLAARNAHKAFMYACALLDPEVEWIFPSDAEGLLSCVVGPDALERRLSAGDFSCVYITSPDYAGHMSDIAALARVCHRHNALLLVDNAHGAYLRFLPEPLHPMDAGADMCCDSAHKTLPVLTGGAYLHIGHGVPERLIERAEDAFALFASSSPSYLILQSLDRANAILAGSAYRKRLSETVERVAALREKLERAGYICEGTEPMKLSIMTAARGYSGGVTADALRARGIECEYADPERVILMPSPATTEAEFRLTEQALLALPARAPTARVAPPLPRAVKLRTIREAMLAPGIPCPADQSEGRVLADACVSCPPCVPILMPGELIDADAVQCFRYYGIETPVVLA